MVSRGRRVASCSNWRTRFQPSRPRCDWRARRASSPFSIPRRRRSLPPDLLANVDILTPNENEALQLLGRDAREIGLAEVPEVAGALLDLGPGTVIIKLGAEGCFLKQRDWEGHVPGFPVNAVDTTAAGDTFNAALAVALAGGEPIERAAVFANAAAAISVTRAGAQPSAPVREEVDGFLRQRGQA